MKRVYITTALTSLVVLIFFSFFLSFWDNVIRSDNIKVGFIYEDDESTPHTWNFSFAQDVLEEEYEGRVQVLSVSNVRDEETEDPLRELANKGCDIIFTNTHSDQFRQVAADYPDIEFCQIAYDIPGDEPLPENFHTFKGEIYQGWYVAGIAAGMKMRELIDTGAIKPEEALVGFVGSIRNPEVVSGYTAFLLGIRSAAPEAVMKVCYTGTWSNYSLEKACAQHLIDEGCIVISHHSATIGPAAACEEAASSHLVIHVGYNQSFLDIAPTTSLVSTRIDWVPYIIGAVDAVIAGRPIEKYVDGRVHGRDMSAGFEKGWVEIMELNKHIAVYGTQEKMNSAIEALKKGNLTVFKGDYIGVDMDDPGRTIDLSLGFIENAESSAPAFRYILKDIITEE